MKEFGRYTLIRRIGIGGMAEIWKAKVRGPEGFEKILAVKKVLPDLVSEGSFVEMFVEEAKLAATLVHPNIVQVFDFGRIGKVDYFLAMEYMAGANVARLMHRVKERNEAPISAQISAYIVIEALKGLGHAHRATDMAGRPLNLVHRDVSPQNLLVSFNGEVKVTDFGIAKVATAISRTVEGEVRGKLAYMSPEQVAGRALDGRSDLFSLGIILYELSTGERFFGSAGTSHEIYTRVASYSGPNDEMMKPVPEELRGVLRRALALKPGDRFADAREFEAALTGILHTDGMMHAREGLAALTRRHFADALLVEMSPDDDEGGLAPALEGGSAGLAATVSTPSRAQNLSAQAQKLEKQLGVENTTLSKSEQLKIVRGVAESPPPEAERGAGVIYGVVGVLAFVLAVGAGVGIHKLRNGSTVTPTATPIAGASPETSGAVTPTATATTTAVVIATPTSKPTARPTATLVARVSPIPTVHVIHTPKPVSALPGYLFVTARPWVEVWVDGVRIAKETPLRSFELPAGRHVLRFVNPRAQFQMEKAVEVPAGGNLSLYVDVPSKHIEFD